VLCWERGEVFHGNDCEYFCLVGYDVVWYCSSVRVFQRICFSQGLRPLATVTAAQVLRMGSACFLSWTQLFHFLGALAELRKETVSFGMSVCLSVRSSTHPYFRMELVSHWTDFYAIWYLSFCRKSVMKIQVSLKSDKDNRNFTWRRLHIYDISWLPRIRNVSNKSCRENENTHFMFSNLNK
jgi:hypothetical protein